MSITESSIRSIATTNGNRLNLIDTSRPVYTDEELAEISRELEKVSATKVIRWAVENFSPHLAMTASMTDAVLIDLAIKVDPAIEVIFIDTGYHFPETLETVEEVRRHYGLNLISSIRHSTAKWACGAPKPRVGPTPPSSPETYAGW